jgi:hypothetical protein
MRFAITQGEQDAADLARRVYRIEGKRRASVEKAAARALRSANPFLSQARDIPRGTTVVVPTVPGTRPADDTFQLEQAAPGPLLDELRRIAHHAGDELTEAIQQEEQEAKETRALLRSRDVKREAKEQPDLEQRLPEVTAEAKGRAEDAAALKEYHAEVAAQIDKDLEELLAALGGTPAAPDEPVDAPGRG